MKRNPNLPIVIGVGSAILFISLVFFGVHKLVEHEKAQRKIERANREVITTEALDSSAGERTSEGVFSSSSSVEVLVLVKIDDTYVTLETSQLVRKGDTLQLTRRGNGWDRFSKWSWKVQIVGRADE